MKIYITGLPSGYEVEHLVRLFYPMAPHTLTPPEAGEDCVWAEKKPDGLWAMVRQGGKCAERSAPLPAPAEAGGEEAIEILWSESGGPDVTAPASRGFGTLVVEKNLARALDAEVVLSFDPGGVRCRMVIPASHLLAAR